MKKRIVVGLVIACTLMLSVGGAQALTSYDQTLTPSATLNSGSPFWLGSFSVPATAGAYFTAATLDLNLSQVAGTTIATLFGGTLTLPASGFGTTATEVLFQSAFTSGLNTFILDPTALQKLNNAISGSAVPVGLYLTNGSATLQSARLTGTVAPEPGSLLLVAAGLIGLPFARKFRNRMKNC